MHPLSALCPEGGHFGHLLESLIIWSIGIALTHSHLSPFHFSLTKSFVFLFFIGFIWYSYLWLGFKWGTFGSHFTIQKFYFITFAIVFGAILCLFITLMAVFYRAFKAVSLNLSFYPNFAWNFPAGLCPSKPGPNLFLCTRYVPCVCVVCVCVRERDRVTS